MAQDNPKDQTPLKTENINIPEKLAEKQRTKQASQQKKAAQAQHWNRVQGVVPRGQGSVPGGLQESAAAMADPGYLQKTRENTERRKAATQEARERVGVKNPHRPVDDANLTSFKAGASGGKVTIGTNPNIAARAARFNKKETE